MDGIYMTEVEKLIYDRGGSFNLTHKDMHKDGRRITTAYVKIDGNYYIGRAICSKQDNFVRKIGRHIALGRAWKAYIADSWSNYKDVPMRLRQREDVCGTK